MAGQTEHQDKTKDRKYRIQQSAAKYLGLGLEDLENRFPGTSTTFWREFQQLQKYRLDPEKGPAEVLNALDLAKTERLSSLASGITREDRWLPQDCVNALEIMVMLLLPIHGMRRAD